MPNQLQMQPSFRVLLPWELEEAKSRIRQALRSSELASVAETAGSVVDYKVESKDRRFWSPHLSVHLTPAEPPSQTEAFCRFSPRPEIWTLVMAVYMVAACCLFAALILALVQVMMGNAPWALLVVPVSAVSIGGLHAASLIGQSWSRDQMELLQSRWQRTLEIAGKSPAAPPPAAAKMPPAGSEQPAPSERPETSGRPLVIGHPEQSEQSEQPEQPEQPEQSEVEPA
jgi:hypothetical protein